MDADRVVAQATENKPDAPPQGFDEFFRRNYRSLMVTAMHVGATTHEADDAATKAMQAVLAEWSSIERPRAWARQAVVRIVLDTWRADRRRRNRELL